MSIQISPVIEALLYGHDCVIVPDFGGFVANEVSARINDRLNLIVPPSKQITFNRHLTHNDGLLINRYALDHGLTFDAAREEIQSEVQSILADLSAGKRVEFEKVGIVYSGKDGAWHFQADEKSNFNTDSFGLGSIYLVPQVKEPVEEQKETKVVAIKQPPLVNTADTSGKSGKRRRRAVIAAATVALPILVIGGIYSYGLLNPQFEGHNANFNPFKPSETVSNFTPRIEEEAIVFEYPNTDSIFDEVVNQNSDKDVIPYSFSEDKIDPNGIRVRISETEDIAEETVSNIELYFIVGGAFRELSNAENMVESLKAKGYDASIFGKRGDLHLVSYGSYSNKSTARKALKQIRQNDNKSAWLKKHKSSRR